MGTEIERKFLIDTAQWKPSGVGIPFKQGYLNCHHARVVRIRSEGNSAKLTIKGLATGACRPEFEYEIPLADANLMLEKLCEQPLITKNRHTELHCGKFWEIDVFHGANHGLVIAEIELESEDENIELPSWVLSEVTNDSRYLNANLSHNPYSIWSQF